ncbi:hypothetical protein POVCU1_080920, partial [Plasmodium ovale curtisi]
ASLCRRSRALAAPPWLNKLTTAMCMKRIKKSSGL